MDLKSKTERFCFIFTSIMPKALFFQDKGSSTMIVD